MAGAIQSDRPCPPLSPDLDPMSASVSTGLSAASNTNPASPTRPSRLRGLSALRNYTQSLALHHSQPGSPTSPGINGLSRLRSGPASPGSPQDSADRGTSYFSREGATDRPPAGDEQTNMPRRRPVGTTSSREQTHASTVLPSSPPARPDGRASETSVGDPATLTGSAANQLCTIRFIPYQDPRSSRPSLTFPAMSRTLYEDCVIRVGRHSEREQSSTVPPGVPSSSPVGFKSKVVSRRHCEFWCRGGQWYVKDVKSSSGTFLNHIRLSNPSVESRPYPVNDGDVIQLGIDFRGGEEQIFRCVKIRIECNRSWQQGINNFNKTTHKRLKALGTGAARNEADNNSNYTSDCSICLMSIAPCQSLFVAPCSHVWHFRCIRRILIDPRTYPQFLCPNCRAVSDLEADVDEVAANWEDEGNSSGSEPDPLRRSETRTAESHDAERDADLENAIAASLRDNLQITDAQPGLEATAQPATAAAPIERRSASEEVVRPASARSGGRASASPSLDSNNRDSQPNIPPASALAEATEGPLTPRNEAGPFIFDGGAGNVLGASRAT